MTDILQDGSEDAVAADAEAGEEALVRERFPSLAKALETARDRLLDRSLRNKLIHTNLANSKARQVRVFDELSDETFALLRGGKALTFLPAPPRGAAAEADGEAEEGADGSTVWVPPSDEDQDERGVAGRHRDTRLQTRMSPEGLQKKLLSLFYEGQTLEEEQGVNVLFLALGFLRWREAKASDVDRFAPLILLPVDLRRDGAKDRFKLFLRPDDLITNVSLQAWMREQFGIELPELPDADEWRPSDYFAEVEAAIGNRAGWGVERDEILLGFFSFAKFLLWRDLDPANWPLADMLTGNPLLQRILLRPDEDDADADTPVIEAHERIDEVFAPASLVHVTDADSSQAIAIQEAMSGKNLVIQGPPGTGKSQTITNIIAGAVHNGKRVLFIAEKMAALDVVHQRLSRQKLGPLCLELHSRKASKIQVLEQIRQGRDAPAPPQWPSRVFSELEETQKATRAHSDALHAAEANSPTAYQLIGRISLLKAQGVAAPEFDIRDAASMRDDEVEAIRRRAAMLDDRLLLAGPPALHPWRGVGMDTPDMLAQERLRPLVRRLLAACEAFETAIGTAAGILGSTGEPTLASAQVWIEALRHLASAPTEAGGLLAKRELAAQEAWVRELVEGGRRLQALRAQLAPQVAEEAWAQDWSAARRVVAEKGQSLFRMLSQPYRRAVADLRGVWKGDMPGARQLRLDTLDGLIGGRKLAAAIKDAEPQATELLAAAWLGERTDWDRLARVLDWQAGCRRFQPDFDLLAAGCLARSEDSAASAQALDQSRQDVIDALDAVTAALELDVAIALSERAWSDLPAGEVTATARQWSAEFDRLVQWPPIRVDLAWLSELGGPGLVAQVTSGSLAAGRVAPTIMLAIAEAQWRQVRQGKDHIARATGDELNQAVGRFRQADTDRIRIAADQVARAHVDRRPTGAAGAAGVLADEMKKSRRLKPVRKLMKEGGQAVQAYKPVFLMSPLSVAQYLEPGVLDFDLLVIDEASQVRPEDALGAIARAKQLIVVGDSRQLPPTSFFSRMVNDEEDEPEENVEEGRAAPVKDVESILNLCSRFPERMLEWHYRSEHPALIATSNRHFYQDRLKLPPSVLVNAGDGETGLLFHQVQSGGYDRGRTARNEIEAEAVAQAVLDHAFRTPNLSLGIGTFSVAQRDCIRDCIDDLARRQPELAAFLQQREGREALFVKNLENIQGDERDVIFISVGYGRDKDGRLTQNFGPVGREGGERRLNVLITRARKRCEVFSSLVAEDIKFEGVGKPGVVALQQFLKLAKDGYSDIAWATDRDFDSPFEEAVAYAIRELGYDCHPQVGMAGFFIDLGVLDPRRPDRYLLGVECDGAAYHSSRYARDRDRLRQQILETRGWKIHRIWSTDWFYRREREIARLKDAIDAALAGASLSSATDHGSYELFETEEYTETSGAGLEEDAPPFQATSSSMLPPYVMADFHHPQLCTAPHTLHDSQLAEIVFQIVQVEQPIHHEEVGRRLAALCGLQRAGGRIQDAAERGLKWARRRGLLKHQGPFWTVEGADIEVARDRSALPSAAPLRKPALIAASELSAAARFALKQSLALHPDELVVETARLLGFARTGKDVSASIEIALEEPAFLRAVETDHLGRLRLRGINSEMQGRQLPCSS